MTTTTYPVSVDDFTNHSAGDYWSGPTHADAHSWMQDAIEAIETRLGAGAASQPIRSAEVTFTETAGAGTYTGSVSLPAGSYLIDVIVHGTAVWDNAGTASMIVGDAADDNGIFDAINLKATDLLAAEGLAASAVAAASGGKAGADLAASQWNRRWLAGARVISGIITTSSTGGTAGRTRMVVLWVEPATTATAATKV